jgi:tetratricopeptide (TPR) repeat protein
MCRPSGISKTLVLLLLAQGVWAEQPPATMTASNALTMAATLEAEAAGNPAKRAVVAGELVKLYAKAGESENALTWARVVMEKNPDPQAYLAGVYAMLGQFADARTILEPEIAAATNAQREVTLCWQAADVCEADGDIAEARKFLRQAADLSVGGPYETTARKRLESFSEKHPASPL